MSKTEVDLAFRQWFPIVWPMLVVIVIGGATYGGVAQRLATVENELQRSERAQDEILTKLQEIRERLVRIETTVSK